MWAGLRQKQRAGGVLDLIDVVGRDVEDHVDATGQKLGNACLLVSQWAEDHLLQGWRAIPVVRIGVERDAHVVIPAGELERPGTDGILGKVLARGLHSLRT